MKDPETIRLPESTRALLKSGQLKQKDLSVFLRNPVPFILSGLIGDINRMKNKEDKP